MEPNTWNPNSRWGIIQNPRLPWIPLRGAITCVKRHIVDRSVLPWRNAALVTQKKTLKKNIAEQTSAIRQGCLSFFIFRFVVFYEYTMAPASKTVIPKKRFYPLTGSLVYRLQMRDLPKALIPILWCNRNWKSWETKSVGRMKKKKIIFFLLHCKSLSKIDIPWTKETRSKDRKQVRK